MIPVYLAVAAVAFLASCAKEYIRYEKKGESPTAPEKKGPQDPCPGQSCAGAQETKGKGINESAWVVGEPTAMGGHALFGGKVQIGQTQIDASRSIYSVKELVPGSDLGFKVTTHIPYKTFLFDSGKSTPANPSFFKGQIAELGGFLVQANSKDYACYLPTTDTSATIYVSGHTDRIGSEQTNLTLSDKRAGTVAKAIFESLASKADASSFDPVVIKSIGMGETMAAAAGRLDGNANTADRRVDVVTSTTGAPFGAEGEWTEVGKITPK